MIFTVYRKAPRSKSNIFHKTNMIAGNWFYWFAWEDWVWGVWGRGGKCIYFFCFLLKKTIETYNSQYQPNKNRVNLKKSHFYETPKRWAVGCSVESNRISSPNPAPLGAGSLVSVQVLWSFPSQKMQFEMKFWSPHLVPLALAFGSASSPNSCGCAQCSIRGCRCKQNKFCLPKSPRGRVSCRNTHTFKWDHSRLFFFQHWLISPALLHSETSRKQQIHKKISLNKMWASVHLLADSKNPISLFIILLSIADFPGHLVVDQKLHQDLSEFWFPVLCAETALKTKLHFSFFIHHKQQ